MPAVRYANSVIDRYRKVRLASRVSGVRIATPEDGESRPRGVEGPDHALASLPCGTTDGGRHVVMAAMNHAAGGHARRARQRERRTAQEEPPAAGPGLNLIRAALEHHPRDPFAVDTGRAVDALKIQWGDSYRIKACEDGYEATRRHGPRVALTAPTPDALAKAMAEDSGGPS